MKLPIERLKRNVYFRCGMIFGMQRSLKIIKEQYSSSISMPIINKVKNIIDQEVLLSPEQTDFLDNLENIK
jgi:hypothetical protein